MALEWHIVGWRSTVVALVDLLPTGDIFLEVDGSGVEEEGHEGERIICRSDW